MIRLRPWDLDLDLHLHPDPDLDSDPHDGLAEGVFFSPWHFRTYVGNQPEPEPEP